MTSPAPLALATDVAGDGPPVVLLHGITEDRTFWAPLVDRITAFATVVRVDLRGHGESPLGPGYELADMADDVRAALLTAGVTEPPLVVGHSLGGLLAAVYAGRHPVRGVVDVDQPLALTAMQAQVQQAAPMLHGEGFHPFMTAMFDAMRGAMDDDAHAALAARRRPRQEVVTGIWSPLLDLTAEELGALVDEIAAGVRCPFLSLHGLDPGPDYATWLAQRIPTATVEVWTDEAGRPLGHHPHLLAPERFTARVREFSAACG